MWIIFIVVLVTSNFINCLNVGNNNTSGKEISRRFGDCEGTTTATSSAIAVAVNSNNKAKEEVKIPEVTSFDMTVLCKLQANSYPCTKGRRNRYGFDIKMKNCVPVITSDCKYSELNAYNTMKDCQNNCRNEGEHPIVVKNLPAKVYCRLQPDFGTCDGYDPQFYYSVSNKECRGFAYSGCGGNLNRFRTIQMCAAACGANIEY